MTVAYSSPAYETLYIIFEWKSPDALMRLRTSEGHGQGLWNHHRQLAQPPQPPRPRQTCRCSPLVSGDVDASLAAYLAELHDQGRAPASASTALAGACFRARLAREPSPAGERLARVLAGYRRTGGDRGRGQAQRSGRQTWPPSSPPATGLAAAAAAASLTRSLASAAGSTPAGLLFMAGMRRSEASALRWAHVGDAADDDGIPVTVRRSKTNQETRYVRFVKAGVARAIWPPARVLSFAIRPAKNSRNRETASIRTRVRWGSELGCPDWEGEW